MGARMLVAVPLATGARPGAGRLARRVRLGARSTRRGLSMGVQMLVLMPVPLLVGGCWRLARFGCLGCCVLKGTDCVFDWGCGQGGRGLCHW